MKIQFNLLEAISNYPNPEKLTGKLRKERLVGLVISCVFFVVISLFFLFFLPIDKHKLPIDKHKEMWPQIASIFLKSFVAAMFFYHCLGLIKGFFLKAYPFGKYRYNYGEAAATGSAVRTVGVLLIHTLAVQQVLTLFIERKTVSAPFTTIGIFLFNYCLLVFLTTIYMSKKAA